MIIAMNKTSLIAKAFAGIVAQLTRCGFTGRAPGTGDAGSGSGIRTEDGPGCRGRRRPHSPMDRQGNG